jgi:O-antigen/teichoic acid export membrane protein
MSSTATPPTLSATTELTPRAQPSRGKTMRQTAADLLVRAGRKSFWPLADQGVASAGNFLTMILVARALPAKSDYGVFGLLLECIFYLNTLQGALIVYPLTVRGAVADAPRLRRLATASMLMTLALAAPIVLAALGVATLTQQVMLGLSGAAALVTWQLQEVARRSLVAQFRYAGAVWGDAIRYLGTAACVWWMWGAGHVTLINVLLAIAGCASVATVVQAVQVGLARIGGRDLLELAREFWIAGRWLLLTSLGALVVSLCGVWALGLFHGTAAVGEFYAIANFTKPLNPIIVTFCGLVLQHAARAYASGGAAAAKRVMLKLSAITCALALPYLLVLVLLPGVALRLFYGADSHFRTPAGQLGLQLFSVGFVLFIVMSLIGSLLNGIGRSRDSFHAQLVNAAAAVAIALPLTIRFGLLGMIAGGAAAAGVQLVAMVWLFRRAR